MKIADLRKLLENTNDELLKKTIVEVYKLVPSAKKDDADSIIADILSGNGGKKVKKDKGCDFIKLSQEIICFLENAYQQNYFAPNRVIPKKDRPKWRFLVKGYVKELDKISLDSEYYDVACDLLVKLYRMMCYACNSYLFSTNDPFQSVGIEQLDFYTMVAKKVLAIGYTEKNIETLLVCAATGGLSMNGLNLEQESALINLLDSQDSIYLSLKIAKEKIAELNDKLSKMSKYANNRYFIESDINNYCDFVLMAEIILKEDEEGISYYFDNCQEYDNEIILYRALNIADSFSNDDKLWVQYYNYGLKKKVKPRDNLIKEYKQKIKK